MSRFPLFDKSRVRVTDNAFRESKCHLADIQQPREWIATAGPTDAETLGLASSIVSARQAGKPVIFFLCGQVIKYGLGRFVIDLIEKGYITHLAVNGSVIIHDWELAYAGSTSEDVRRYIADGHFGNWSVPGMLNSAHNEHDSQDSDWTVPSLHAGETYGTIIMERMRRDGVGGDFSVVKACDAANIPLTAHVLIGGDINHQQPNCHGSMFATLYNDFLSFTHTVSQMAGGGVYVNVGSQVSGTEVFLKALSMARNVAVQDGNPPIHDIVTGMLDYVKLPSTWRESEAADTEAAYYYRPWKTLLLRTVACGGSSFYLSGDHRNTLPQLWKAVTRPH